MIYTRCRICLEGQEKELLISPCRCKDTLGLIHKSCLEEWLNVAQKGSCEICCFEFQIDRVKPGFIEWIRRGGNPRSGSFLVQTELQRRVGASQLGTSLSPQIIMRHRHMFTDLACLIVMFPLVLICAVMTLYASYLFGWFHFRWEVLALTVLLFFLTSIFLIWIVMTARYHLHSWRIWRQEHVQIKVVTCARPALDSLPQDSSANTNSIISSSSPAVSPPPHRQLSSLGSRSGIGSSPGTLVDLQPIPRHGIPPSATSGQSVVDSCGWTWHNHQQQHQQLSAGLVSATCYRNLFLRLAIDEICAESSKICGDDHDHDHDNGSSPLSRSSADSEADLQEELNFSCLSPMPRRVSEMQRKIPAGQRHLLLSEVRRHMNSPCLSQHSQIKSPVLTTHNSTC